MKQAKTLTEIVVGNFHSPCCEKMLYLWFSQEGIAFHSIKGNSIFLRSKDWQVHREKIHAFLNSVGLYILMRPQEKIVEQIISEIHNLIFRGGVGSSMINNSDYLVEKLGFSYQKLSSIFKKEMKITLEKYIISQKIERVKQLLDQEELSLSEIAYMMGYSSVQYLSAQFKAVSGMIVSDYKAHRNK